MLLNGLVISLIVSSCFLYWELKIKTYFILKSELGFQQYSWWTGLNSNYSSILCVSVFVCCVNKNVTLRFSEWHFINNIFTTVLLMYLIPVLVVSSNIDGAIRFILTDILFYDLRLWNIIKCYLKYKIIYKDTHTHTYS